MNKHRIVHEQIINGEASAIHRWYVRATCENDALDYLLENEDVAFWGWRSGPGQSFGYQVSCLGWNNARKAYVLEQFSGLDI